MILREPNRGKKEKGTQHRKMVKEKWGLLRFLIWPKGGGVGRRTQKSKFKGR